MKILLIDKDNKSLSTLKSCLEPMGHRLTHETDKNKAVERLSSSEFDIIFLDPVPLSSPRPVVLNIRRGVSNYPYIFLLSETASREEAIRAGSNDIMPKPLEKTMVQEKAVNAERLSKLMKRIGDDSEDFPSAGGVIAKSAFNQLFLSALDRADRYGERTFVLFIGVSNYQDIRDMDGPYAADYAVAKLSKYLVLLRRQSDIIGQTGKHEFALLLQRPVYDTEPLEAANRFAESLAGIKDITSSGSSPVEITVTLIDVPIGSKIAEHVVRPGKTEQK
ncbi:MAG: diguanylate cyclase [Alphaproteobacteria bacterium]|nr:diguanylate cyclase [Alphaproteobacteria bacterium]